MCARRLLVMRIRPSLLRFRASCRALKVPAEPGMAMETNRSFPRILCQRLAEIRLAAWSSPKILARASLRCGGSSRVWRMVSTTQPNIPLRVDQLPSPFFIFLSETASRRASEETSGRARTLSMECRRCRRSTFMRRGPP